MSPLKLMMPKPEAVVNLDVHKVANVLHVLICHERLYSDRNVLFGFVFEKHGHRILAMATRYWTSMGFHHHPN